MKDKSTARAGGPAVFGSSSTRDHGNRVKSKTYSSGRANGELPSECINIVLRRYQDKGIIASNAILGKPVNMFEYMFTSLMQQIRY